MPTKPKKQAEKKPAKKRGRKSTFRQATARAIIDKLSQGIPLAEICRKREMPAIRTVYDWQDEFPEFAAGIARARLDGYDRIAADCLRIADTPKLGTETTMKPTGRETRSGDMLGHRKLQVETRLKLLAKWDPKRYGERVTQEISGPDGKPIRSETSHVVSEELEAKILERTMEAARFAATVEPPASFRGKGGEE